MATITTTDTVAAFTAAITRASFAHTDRITRDTVVCGGRRPAELLAGMGAARHGH
jgi:hypothetical protein